MNDTTWLAEDGRLLKDLRTSAGWDLHEFSRAASISPAQLRQLEEGGNELFYSPSIKFQLGRKLLRKLGADVVRAPEEPVPETPSLFGFSPSPAIGHSLEESLSAAPAPILQTREHTSPTWSKPWVAVLGSVGVLAVAGLFGTQLRTPSADTHRAVTVASAPAPTPAEPTPPSIVDSSLQANPTSTLVTQTPAEPPLASSTNVTPLLTAATPVTTPAPETSTVKAAAADASGCQWASGPGNAFMPRGMEKPSTYVHFVANADANICVQDRNQKVTQVNLKAGEKITIRGSAPWRIQTGQWADVWVFFQGYRMPVPATATLVTLNPRLEPLAEAAAPASN